MYCGDLWKRRIRAQTAQKHNNPNPCLVKFPSWTLEAFLAAGSAPKDSQGAGGPAEGVSRPRAVARADLVAPQHQARPHPRDHDRDHGRGEDRVAAQDALVALDVRLGPEALFDGRTLPAVGAQRQPAGAVGPAAAGARRERRQRRKRPARCLERRRDRCRLCLFYLAGPCRKANK